MEDALKKELGGEREGAGRPPGKENEATMTKRLVKKALEKRILNSADDLINSQMNLAKGVQMLYKIEKDKDGKNKKPELVIMQEEIEAYLAGECEGDYYFITTERPDNKALDSLLDRTFGKARQNVGLDGGEDEEGNPKPLYAGQSTISLSRHEGNTKDIPVEEKN